MTRQEDTRRREIRTYRLSQNSLIFLADLILKSTASHVFIHALIGFDTHANTSSVTKATSRVYRAQRDTIWIAAFAS